MWIYFTKTDKEIMKLLLILLFFGNFQHTDAACDFSSDIDIGKAEGIVWTSSEFGDMTFYTSVVEFVETGSTAANWTCHVSSGSKYVIQSLDTGTSASLGTNVYFYYCFEFTKQGTGSYLYYHPTATLGVTGDRKLQLASNTTTVATACSESVDTAEYHVMVRKDTASTVKNNCASPLLGDFLYACASGSTDNGTVNACDSSKQTLVFNHTQCTPSSPVLFSAGGVLNCVAKTSGTVASETVYYQTLYNTDATVNGLSTYQFVCLAVTSASNGTAYFSYTHDTCSAGQTPATSNGFEPLVPASLCPITEDTSASGVNVGLIVGLVIGLILLLLIIGLLVFYFCFYKKDPNAGKPIVENTKPRFEDPDKDDIIEDLELVDTSSTPVTRDEITFEAMSPNILSNGRLTNGHVRSLSPTGYAQSSMTNGSVRRDSGIDMNERLNDRPIPRIGLNPAKESMVIFNGDEKVISGNDTRIVPNENPNARTLRMDNSMTGEGPLTLQGLEDEESDELGELSTHSRDNMLYPSLPREKSNLMPPIETVDRGKEKEDV